LGKHLLTGKVEYYLITKKNITKKPQCKCPSLRWPEMRVFVACVQENRCRPMFLSTAAGRNENSTQQYPRWLRTQGRWPDLCYYQRLLFTVVPHVTCFDIKFTNNQSKCNSK
jgi:hypothetical protein